MRFRPSDSQLSSAYYRNFLQLWYYRIRVLSFFGNCRQHRPWGVEEEERTQRGYRWICGGCSEEVVGGGRLAVRSLGRARSLADEDGRVDADADGDARTTEE